MVNHVVCVCIFCLICATHTCSGHHPEEENHAERSGKVAEKELSADELLDAFFRIYGNGKRGIHKEGLEKILRHLDLMEDGGDNHGDDGHDHEHHDERVHSFHDKTGNQTDDKELTCVHRDKFYDSIKNKLNFNVMTTTNNATTTTNNTTKSIDDDTFSHYCPALLLRTILGSCIVNPSVPTSNNAAHQQQQYHAWIYSTLAITLISACGILGLAVIPVMQKRFYQPLLQFLVALAVGTLAGDALLHLLPHSMSGGHEHDDDHHTHDENMWKGVVAMFGLILFFCMERLIMLIAKWRKKKQLKDKLPTRLKVIEPESSTKLTNAMDKQCIHKYSSFPYCYDEIKMELESQMDDKEEMRNNQNANNDVVKSLINHHHHLTTDALDDEKHDHSNNHIVDGIDTTTTTTATAISANVSPKSLNHRNREDADSIEYTVILREHENPHHGHSHTHGHVHAAPKSITSVAWMVIMGDGLHNFTDGMAIGAAFANSTAGGFSTAVAVFCHELPHELGDFAMLLKAGMTMKQALYYNLLSSILCLFGNIFGLWLGHTAAASSWIFAAAAGMFLYIALVDMIPELSSSHGEDNLLQGVLHLVGLLLGFGIMALIAIYEHDIKSIFNEAR